METTGLAPFGLDEFTFISFGVMVSAYLGILANNSKYLARISGVAVTMFCGALLSNFGILPTESEVYNAVWKYFVPLIIPLILMEANFKMVYKNTGRMLIVYLLGALGTIVGSLVSYFVVYVGPETHKIIGMLAASNIGGSINFVSVSHALDLVETSFFLAGNAADNISMALYFLAMTVAVRSKKFVRFFDKNTSQPASIQPVESNIKASHNILFEYPSFAALLVSFLFFIISKIVMHFFYFDGGMIIVVTVLALLFANLFPSAAAALANSKQLAQALIMIFFAVIGANCNIKLVVEVAPHLFIMMICMTAFQFIFALVGAKVFRISLPETIIACNANAGGPATASAMASSYGWHHLVVPGILCGTLGYAIGTFVGVFIGHFLETLDLHGFLSPLKLLIDS